MIIYNKLKYATTDSELVDSLFKDGGTLEKLHAIKITKNAVRYFITPDNGFGFNKFGCPFKFSKLSNGRFWYQHTFDADKETFEKEYNSLKMPGWASYISIL